MAFDNWHGVNLLIQSDLSRPFIGSMSHAIAAHYAGLHLTGCELDPDYFAAGIERVKRETAQMDMFADAPKIAQSEQLFLDTPSA